jgi:hypothetical protein
VLNIPQLQPFNNSPSAIDTSVKMNVCNHAKEKEKEECQ